MVTKTRRRRKTSTEVPGRPSQGMEIRSTLRADTEEDLEWLIEETFIHATEMGLDNTTRIQRPKKDQDGGWVAAIECHNSLWSWVKGKIKEKWGERKAERGTARVYREREKVAEESGPERRARLAEEARGEREALSKMGPVERAEARRKVAEARRAERRAERPIPEYEYDEDEDEDEDGKKRKKRRYYPRRRLVKKPGVAKRVAETVAGGIVGLGAALPKMAPGMRTGLRIYGGGMGPAARAHIPGGGQVSRLGQMVLPGAAPSPLPKRRKRRIQE